MKQKNLKKAVKQLMKHSIYTDIFALISEDSDGNFVPTQHWSSCWYELKHMTNFPKQGSKQRKAMLFALSNLVNFGPGWSEVGRRITLSSLGRVI